MIYIPVWLDQKRKIIHEWIKQFKGFTFQYGQIRNHIHQDYIYFLNNIYIPVWLDQKPYLQYFDLVGLYNLHSSMVRLETFSFILFFFSLNEFTFQYGQIRNLYANDFMILELGIYIPVWLDQKRRKRNNRRNAYVYLHSSMFRLETYYFLLET